MPSRQLPAIDHPATSPGSPASPGWLAEVGVGGLVSVIIPTFNRAALLMDVLGSLAAQT
jgi:hypothetical protein